MDVRALSRMDRPISSVPSGPPPLERPNSWLLRSMSFCRHPARTRAKQPRSLSAAGVKPSSSWAPATRGPRPSCFTSKAWTTRWVATGHTRSPFPSTTARSKGVWVCGLWQSRRSLCEEALLKIRGVISFTFQMTVKRCIVRIRSDLRAEVRPPSSPLSSPLAPPPPLHCFTHLDVASQALASAIAATQVMKAQQVVKGENGDEVSCFCWSDVFVSHAQSDRLVKVKSVAQALSANTPVFSGVDPLGRGQLSAGGAQRGPARLPAGGREPVSGARQGSEPGRIQPGWSQLAGCCHQLPVPLLLLVTPPPAAPGQAARDSCVRVRRCSLNVQEGSSSSSCWSVSCAFIPNMVHLDRCGLQRPLVAVLQNSGE